MEALRAFAGEYRFEALPQEDAARRTWSMRSRFILDRFWDEHERTLEEFGLSRALAEDEWERFASAVHRAANGYRYAEPYLTLEYTITRAAAEAFMERSRRIVEELDALDADVWRFLLTGKAFDLPWIVVTRTESFMGWRYAVAVHSGECTAEDVRDAYNRARRHFAGGAPGKALPDHILPLVLLESTGLAQGLTRRERYHRWNEYAREWSLKEYSSVESYDGTVKSLAKAHRWIRELREQPVDFEQVFPEFAEGAGSE